MNAAIFEALKKININNQIMKKFSLRKSISTLFILLAAVVFSSCEKEKNETNTTNNNDKHYVDPRLVGKWLWTQGSDGAYYDDNGVYKGAAYGMATQYKVQADGYGTCYNHIYSSIGAGTYIEVNITYDGFFESDDKGHFGFFPTSGTYKSTSGENRALRPDELWNTKTNSGRSFLYQQLTFTTQGGRSAFQTTASDGTVDTYFKVP
jgi:hypothetical protein